MKIDSQFDNQNILITGGAGFVGSNLTKLILKTSNVNRIVVVDNLLSSEEFNLPINNKLVFIKNSITSDRVLDELKDNFDYVFHLATFHGNQNSIYNPLADHENNTLTTLKLYERLKYFKNLKKIVYTSAGCSVAEKTFDDAKATTENDPISINQDSPYSISKIIGEFYSVYYFKQHGIPIVRARFQNVYGPGEILGAGIWRGTYATVWRNVIPTFIYKAINNLPLPLENEGKASRDFIYIDDVCKGLILCALKGKPGDVYNIASGRETTILELATLINKTLNNYAGFEMKTKRDWDNSGKRFGSIEKSKNELGFTCEIPLEKGLLLTIEWTKNNLELIKTCIKKHSHYLNERI